MTWMTFVAVLVVRWWLCATRARTPSLQNKRPHYTPHYPHTLHTTARRLLCGWTSLYNILRGASLYPNLLYLPP